MKNTITVPFTARDFQGARFISNSDCPGARAFKRATNWRHKTYHMCTYGIGILTKKKVHKDYLIRDVILNGVVINGIFGPRAYDMVRHAFTEDSKTQAQIVYNIIAGRA